ncbi:hypothetical protein AMTR_s00043p00132100 [Amborella trichopoda]|uniref:Uncharacterized protein n=1 Tax=Amborella trichopoda TaxID=13333 RepID=W1PRV5_AMBTC|nr:hypothetical protein AMTR_s00043p00132100 [Amborella trichopoda]
MDYGEPRSIGFINMMNSSLDRVGPINGVISFRSLHVVTLLCWELKAVGLNALIYNLVKDEVAMRKITSKEGGLMMVK